MSLLPLAAAALAVTPQGPATLRDTAVAPLPHAPFGPSVIVGWQVEVGEGGTAGPVALRVLTGDPQAPAPRGLQRGPVEQLPAEAGRYAFPARLRFHHGDAIGLDQQTGGHAIVVRRREDLFALDVWRPPLGVGEARGYDERDPGGGLALSWRMEEDVDEDGYGDETQDENDLALRARPGRRSIRVTLRNRGARVVDRPHVRIGSRVIELRSIPPGGTRSVLVRGLKRGFRVKLTAGSEGFDPTPVSVVVRGR